MCIHIKLYNHLTVSKAEGHCLSKLLNGNQLTVTSNKLTLESTAWNWATYEARRVSTSCNSVANVDFFHDDLHIFFWYLKCKPSSHLVWVWIVFLKSFVWHFRQRGPCEGNHLRSCLLRMYKNQAADNSKKNMFGFEMLVFGMYQI